MHARTAVARAAGAIAAAAALHAGAAAALDLAQSYDLALTHDRQIMVAKARADAGREVLPLAVSQVLPNVTFSGGYGETDQRRSLGGYSEPSARYPTTTFALTVQQAIYRPLQFSQITQAKAKVAGVDAQLDRDYQTLGVRLVAAYFDALLARDSLDLILAQKATYEAQLRAAKLAFASGAGTRTDIDDVQARYDLLLADEIRARQSIDSSTLQLQVFVGEAVSTLATLDPKRFAVDAHDPGTLQEWLDRAVRYSPELRTLSANWDAAKSGIDMARAGYLPTLDLVVQGAYNKGDAANTFPSTENRTGYVGVQLNVPIYSGGGTNSAVRQSTALAEEARASYEFTLLDLKLRVQQQFDAVRAGISRVHALEQAVASAEQNVLSNRKGVQAGTRTMLDVLTVEQQRFGAQLDLTRARYQVLVAWSTLLSHVGDLDAGRIGQINRELKG